MSNILSDSEINACYPQLLGYATRHLADPITAADVVQEAWAAAVKYQHKFTGKSAFATWVFAILKNKLQDFYATNKRDEALIYGLFDESGAWECAVPLLSECLQIGLDGEPAATNPNEDSHAFWQVLKLCLDELPPNQARVFMMKEYLELDSDEICAECAISLDNFYTLMHRARLRLQTCLTQNWLED